MATQTIDQLLAHGVGQQNRGDVAGALAAYWQVLQLAPRQFDALHLIGVCKCQLGAQAEGSWFITLALEQRPDDSGALYNLGMAQAELHRHADALRTFDRALGVRPDHAASWFSRGDSLQIEGRFADAVTSYQRALALQPGMSGALSNLGTALLGAGRAAEAIPLLQQARDNGADPVTVGVNLGRALQELGRTADACDAYAAACIAGPDAAQPRWLWAIATIPDVATGSAEIAASRPAFAAGIEQLGSWYDNDTGFRRDRLELAWPFYLAYQNRNNGDLLAAFGALRGRLMAEWWQRLGISIAVPQRAGPIRVGIVSAHLHSHSVWHAITRGWFAHFDPARFALHAFHLGRKSDGETAFAQSRAASFTFGERKPEAWVRAILAVAPEVLIYPGIGMDNLSANLAALRLAPVQLASWGHPETTGLPNIDGYISAEAFEPKGADAAYSEQLIRLPRLGVAYVPQPVTPMLPDLAALGIDPARPILLCAGAPFKYMPEFDTALAMIASRLGTVQLIFFRTKNNSPQTDRLMARLSSSFAAEGLDFAEHARLVPYLNMEAFHGLMQRADAYLDTPGFSGFNTAMQAVAAGVPVVAFEAAFMRGRLASGIMRCLGLDEMVAGTVADYVTIAVRLATDEKYRARTSARQIAALPSLYDDADTVRALEAELESRVPSP